VTGWANTLMSSDATSAQPSGVWLIVRWKRRDPILIADDDPSTVDGLRELLTEFGYKVVTAADGQEAMNLLVGGLVPSLLIVDLGMPNVAGDELLKYVQSDPYLRHVPVLVITGTPERVGRTVSDAVIEKPVNVIALMAHVNRLTARGQRKGIEVESRQ
jgi:CheY-like chemotaxis protein